MELYEIAQLELKMNMPVTIKTEDGVTIQGIFETIEGISLLIDKDGERVAVPISAISEVIKPHD